MDVVYPLMPKEQSREVRRTIRKVLSKFGIQSG
jgi:hypothetical protein